MHAVRMSGITKNFATVRALDNVDFKAEKACVHALLGENGAGKTTLMNILYGLYSADSGEVYINEKKTIIKNPAASIANGIGMVHQHFMLVGKLTVAQNVILGAEKTTLGFFNSKKIRNEILEISEKFGLRVEPDKKIENISVGMQQRVEILKVLYRGADILIFDEPTAVLTPQEISELTAIIKNLADSGKTVILITHKLKEIKQAAQKCTVIRRGFNIGTVDVCDVSEKQLASMMVGREVVFDFLHEKKNEPGDVILKIENLTVEDNRGVKKLNGFNLELRKGEIFGIAGVDGNGQKELVEAITSLRKIKSGSIKINGNEIANTSPANVIKNKINTIPEDRQQLGLVLDFSVEDNAILGKQNEFSNKGILQFEKITKHATDLIEKFDIRPSGCEKTKMKSLSGGNQQKFIIAREITNNPDVLIAVQPTRGVDIGAIEFIHRTLLAEREKAILLISLDLDEILSLSDTIGVIYEGKIVKTMKNENIDEEKLGLLMAGGNA
ncbi:MAG: ABC transporter ATP-binding protein [Clostridiales bacterium]|jgi:simple sugar transport system ATP-binding protein|nr:ABC transporter ATP-binding protein [Clostridiales bacterium]